MVNKKRPEVIKLTATNKLDMNLFTILTTSVKEGEEKEDNETLS
jgi:hypothetical protein